VPGQEVWWIEEKLLGTTRDWFLKKSNAFFKCLERGIGTRVYDKRGGVPVVELSKMEKCDE